MRKQEDHRAQEIKAALKDNLTHKRWGNSDFVLTYPAFTNPLTLYGEKMVDRFLTFPEESNTSLWGVFLLHMDTRPKIFPVSVEKYFHLLAILKEHTKANASDFRLLCSMRKFQCLISSLLICNQILGELGKIKNHKIFYFYFEVIIHNKSWVTPETRIVRNLSITIN